MARIGRVVLPDTPHHVTQRGNRRQQVFFDDDDYAAYRDLLLSAKAASGARVWGWCLMPNHVHVIIVPRTTDDLRAFFAEAHRRYTRMINFRFGWRGHLWQERFHSFPMDAAHLWAAIRYVDLNPVRAQLVERPEAWRWSSAGKRLLGSEDALLDDDGPVSADWRVTLGGAEDQDANALIRRHGRTGRPLGDDAFLDDAEARAGRALRPKKPGPKPAELI